MSMPPYPPPGPPPAWHTSVDPIQLMLARQGEIANTVSNISENVARALTRLEVVENRNLNADQLQNDLNTRVRVLERFQWRLTGAATVAGFLAGYVGSLIKSTHG